MLCTRSLKPSLHVESDSIPPVRLFIYESYIVQLPICNANLGIFLLRARRIQKRRFLSFNFVCK